MKYEITLSTPYATKTYTRKRRDAASLLFERVAYAVVKSYALLDRAMGARAVQRARRARKSDCQSVSVSLYETTIRFQRIA